MKQKYYRNQGAHDIATQVHKSVNKGFRVKALIFDLGMYINGMMVFAPDDEHEEWAVYTPAKLAGRGNWVHTIEFDKSKPLWNELHEACIRAVEEQSSEDVEQNRLAEPSFGEVGKIANGKLAKLDTVYEVNVDEPINLDDIFKDMGID